MSDNQQQPITTFDVHVESKDGYAQGKHFTINESEIESK